jgi:N6-adenosine-specific RNA methylase IME4
MSGNEIVTYGETGLKSYDELCRRLDKASRVDEVKEIKNRAEAMRVYAKQAGNKKLEADAAVVRLRAVRKVGQMMAEQPKATGGQPYQKATGSTGFSENPVATLGEAGIDKNLANAARKLAKFTDDAFEHVEAETRQAVERGVERRVLKAIDLAEAIAEARAERANQQGGTVADLEALIAEGRCFGVVYADPPWKYDHPPIGDRSRSPERHYDTMTLDALKALPVAALAAAHAAVFMWATGPMLAQAIELLSAWGFEYKSVAFTWVKTVRSGGDGLHWGTGYWTRANAEYVLFGKRGSPRRLDMGVHSIVMDGSVVVSPVQGHSRKPAEVHSHIEQLVRGPYLELFAREQVPGWITWGNEILPPSAEDIAAVVEQIPRVRDELDAYDARLDMDRSVRWAYQRIRDRVAAGGPGWRGYGPKRSA